jgi:hypothetical protein
MKSLKILGASWDCGINQVGIDGCLQLVELRTKNNEKIVNVSHLKSLKILEANGNCGIDQAEINGCLQLMEQWY